MRLASFIVVVAISSTFACHVCAQAESKETVASLTKKFEASKKGRKKNYLEFKPQFEKLAKANEGSEEGVKAELWLLGQTWWLRQDGKMESASVAILDHILSLYPRSEQLAEVANVKYVLPKERRVAYFQKIGKLSPHASVRAAMLLGEATSLKNPGKKSALERLKKDYGKLAWKASTYNDIADAMLNPHEKSQLKIGQVAPDIKGTDIDGTSFKLSDYRGKVILLDFWGNW